MSNRDVARLFNELAKLMEYNGDNTFKIRSYSNAYVTIRRLGEPILEMDYAERGSLRNIGQAINDKLEDIKETGTFPTLERYREQIDPGIQDMLQIKGIGAKKLATLVEGLEINTPGELLYACIENRLVDLKGFGHKSQEKIKHAVKYFIESKGKLLYRDARKVVDELYELLGELGDELIEIKDLALKRNVVEQIEFASPYLDPEDWANFEEIEARDVSEDTMDIVFQDQPIRIWYWEHDELTAAAFRHRGSSDFLTMMDEIGWDEDAQSEEELLESSSLPYIPIEYRESGSRESYSNEKISGLIEDRDVRGLVHNHSTWSDGIASVKVMAQTCLDMGYSYFGIADHSKSAFYANGLSAERVRKQWEEIDALNEEFVPKGLRILKGSEVDILYDGSLDYAEDLLKGLDYVVASVHAHLKMDLEKATSRLLAAIENPYTDILGHATGRLLLAREAYPLDHKKIIDACAENGVSIELNANPIRLDMDWRWLEYCMQREVMISINPDAHSPEGLADVSWGVISARKGGLQKKFCLNALSVDDFLAKCQKTR